MNLEPEYATGGYQLTNANELWYDWAKTNIVPAQPDKNFELVYVGHRKYDDGYMQMVICIRLTNPHVVQEKNKPLPASMLVTTQLLFVKVYPDFDDSEFD